MVAAVLEWLLFPLELLLLWEVNVDGVVVVVEPVVDGHDSLNQH